MSILLKYEVSGAVVIQNSFILYDILRYAFLLRYISLC